MELSDQLDPPVARSRAAGMMGGCEERGARSKVRGFCQPAVCADMQDWNWVTAAAAGHVGHHVSGGFVVTSSPTSNLPATVAAGMDAVSDEGSKLHRRVERHRRVTKRGQQPASGNSSWALQQRRKCAAVEVGSEQRGYTVVCLGARESVHPCGLGLPPREDQLGLGDCVPLELQGEVRTGHVFADEVRRSRTLGGRVESRLVSVGDWETKSREQRAESSRALSTEQV